MCFQALLLANTSSRIGDLLQCKSLIGGYLKHDVRSGTTITTQLLCKNIRNPEQYKVTEVTMKKGKQRFTDTENAWNFVTMVGYFFFNS